MLRPVKALLLFFVSALPLAAAAEPLQRLPELSGYYLNGEPVSLPDDLSDPATLIVLIEDDPGTEDLSGWRAVSEELGEEAATLFVVVMGEKRGIDRAMAAGRLRAEVADPVLRASMVPVFERAGALRHALDVASGSGVSAVLVDPDGRVMWRARGAAGETTLKELGGVLETLSVRPPAAPLAPAASTPGPSRDKQEEAGPAGQATVAAATGPAPESSEPGLLPSIKGYTLSGQRRLLPDDLGEAGIRLVLVPGFAGTDRLLSVFDEARTAAGDADWLVLVFMGDTPKFGKAVAAGRMRADITSPEVKARVMPVYMDLSAFERLAQLVPGQGARVIEVTRSGMIAETGCAEPGC